MCGGGVRHVQKDGATGWAAFTLCYIGCDRFVSRAATSSSGLARSLRSTFKNQQELEQFGGFWKLIDDDDDGQYFSLYTPPCASVIVFADDIDCHAQQHT